MSFLGDGAAPAMSQPFIWIEAETWSARERDAARENTDVVVTLPDGSRWGATFYAYGNIALLHEAARQTGETLAGAYFWAPNLILIEEVHRERIEQAVRDLISQGDFELAFRRLGAALAGPATGVGVP